MQHGDPLAFHVVSLCFDFADSHGAHSEWDGISRYLDASNTACKEVFKPRGGDEDALKEEIGATDNLGRDIGVRVNCWYEIGYYRKSIDLQMIMWVNGIDGRCRTLCSIQGDGQLG